MSGRPIVTMKEFRKRFWKLYPNELLELGNRYWKSKSQDLTSLQNNAFFTEERLKHLSEHFNTLEDAVKLGVNMFYHRDVLLDLERRYYTNISQMTLTLFANFIITRHNGDKRTVLQLVNIFLNIAKTQCAEIIKQEFEAWSQNDIGDYKSLDSAETNWKKTFDEKKKKIIFGWEDKRTPERYFDYLGNFHSLQRFRQNILGLENNELHKMIELILKDAPPKFAFQFLPSANIYRSQYGNLDLGLVANDMLETKWTEKLLWKIAETDMEKKDFEAKLMDIFYSNRIEGDLERFWDAYPRSLFMKVFRSLVYFSEKKEISVLFDELKKIIEFRSRIQKFEADCKQSYIIEYNRG